MQKTYEEFWHAYKEIYKTSRNEFFLKKATRKDIAQLLLLSLMFVGGLAVHALSDGRILLQIIGIGLVICTVLLVLSIIKEIPFSSTTEKTVQRISALKKLLNDYKIDYQNPEIFRSLTDYISERTKRYNPFAYIIEAAKSTATVAVLVVTFFSGSQEGTMTGNQCAFWILRILLIFFVVRLILTVFQNWSVPVIERNRIMGQRFLDDMNELKLFSNAKE